MGTPRSAGELEEVVLHVSKRRVVVSFKVIFPVVEIHGDRLGGRCKASEDDRRRRL